MSNVNPHWCSVWWWWWCYTLQCVKKGGAGEEASYSTSTAIRISLLERAAAVSDVAMNVSVRVSHYTLLLHTTQDLLCIFKNRSAMNPLPCLNPHAAPSTTSLGMAASCHPLRRQSMTWDKASTVNQHMCLHALQQPYHEPNRALLC